MIEAFNVFCQLLFLMMAGHALGDRPLQEGRIRTEKYAPRGVPGDYKWLYGLSCHALIHGGLVAAISGFWWLGVAEMVAHWVIDDQKIRRRYGLIADQILHAICKIMWAVIATYMFF